ncbi:hypothetical protein TW95_gp1134 [Pandoravirus inopinatum]|uniref:Uncharacterized protein n=1 Tax=Pandoravirus inopinatum TaxID=1605721 RepID=A0A0B5IYD3_9VIRU|nr:hypothetical protein TW95_gp1134 [Pandoravirus inopinatum]AJF97868.1 hypothetical protein [Pandoravirus inopinatum]
MGNTDADDGGGKSRCRDEGDHESRRPPTQWRGSAARRRCCPLRPRHRQDAAQLVAYPFFLFSQKCTRMLCKHPFSCRRGSAEQRRPTAKKKERNLVAAEQTCHWPLWCLCPRQPPARIEKKKSTAPALSATLSDFKNRKTQADTYDTQTTSYHGRTAL